MEANGAGVNKTMEALKLKWHSQNDFEIVGQEPRFLDARISLDDTTNVYILSRSHPAFTTSAPPSVSVRGYNFYSLYARGYNTPEHARRVWVADHCVSIIERAVARYNELVATGHVYLFTADGKRERRAYSLVEVDGGVSKFLAIDGIKPCVSTADAGPICYDMAPGVRPDMPVVTLEPTPPPGWLITKPGAVCDVPSRVVLRTIEVGVARIYVCDGYYACVRRGCWYASTDFAQTVNWYKGASKT